MRRLFVGGPYDGEWKDVDELVNGSDRVVLPEPTRPHSIDLPKWDVFPPTCVYDRVRYNVRALHQPGDRCWMDVWVWIGLRYEIDKYVAYAFEKSVGW